MQTPPAEGLEVRGMPKYILNIDKTYWRVKIRLGPNEFANKCFRYDVDSRDEKLLAAVSRRNAALKKNNLMHRLGYAHSPQITNVKKRGEFIGVHQSNRNWIVRYSLNGVEYKQSFSKKKYGNSEAYAKACDVRRRHTRLVLN